MSDRGEYRSIRRVLLDGQDFQRLPANARWVFVALKLNIGQTGIDVQYADALACQLAQQTGLSARAVQDALTELTAGDWIRREANVLWVVGHLTHDPHLSTDDPKHRKSVQRNVAGLPRLEIVRDYILSAPDWFPPEEAPSMGLAWAFDGPSKQEKEKETETETPSGEVLRPAAKRPPPADALFEEAWAVYPKRPGNSKAESYAKWLARVREGVDPLDMIEGTRRYAKYIEANPPSDRRYIKQSQTFYGKGRHFEDDWTPAAPSDPLSSRIAALIEEEDAALEKTRQLLATRGAA